jgi:RAB protein geranylgeranyltransferase component A
MARESISSHGRQILALIKRGNCLPKTAKLVARFSSEKSANIKIFSRSVLIAQNGVKSKGLQTVTKDCHVPKGGYADNDHLS